jgi:hypothetical protein
LSGAAGAVAGEQAEVPPSIGSSLGLLKQPVFFLAVLGIFLYVGAEASMGRFLFPGLKEMGVSEETASKFGPAMFFLLLTIGRLLGGVLLTVMSARTCFRLSALLGLVGAGAIMTGSPTWPFPLCLRPAGLQTFGHALLRSRSRKTPVRQRTERLDVHGQSPAGDCSLIMRVCPARSSPWRLSFPPPASQPVSAFP